MNLILLPGPSPAATGVARRRRQQLQRNPFQFAQFGSKFDAAINGYVLHHQ